MQNVGKLIDGRGVQSGLHSKRLSFKPFRRGSKVMATDTTDAPGCWISSNLGEDIMTRKSVGGSDWSNAYIYETSIGSKYFVKVARNRSTDMFSGEALGLEAMRGTNTLLIPRVFTVGNVSDSTPSMGSYIVMEYLDIKRGYDPAKLGRELARMHLAEPSDPNARAGMYGFAVDNTIGGTPQPNGWSDNWVDFFRERRLRHQLKLTGDPQLMQLGGELCDNLEYFFDGVQVRPSIIHGDLWSGNIGSVGGQPAIFDPATYYGHHEAEFGMSWCSGFSNAFYTAYHELIPKAQGWESRHDIYTLYHYLNHYNLFGYGYYQQCIETLRRLLRRL